MAVNDAGIEDKYDGDGDGDGNDYFR